MWIPSKIHVFFILVGALIILIIFHLLVVKIGGTFVVDLVQTHLHVEEKLENLGHK